MATAEAKETTVVKSDGGQRTDMTEALGKFKATESRRWESRREPFRGFDSPPGRF